MIVILHPAADPTGWKGVRDALNVDGRPTRELTWTGWIGELPFQPGQLTASLCEDAVVQLSTIGALADDGDTGPVLIGHNLGGQMSLLLADRVRASAVIVFAPPGRPSALMRLGGTRALGTVLGWTASMSDRWRAALAGRVYGWLNFAHPAYPGQFPKFLAVARDRQQASEWIRRANAVLAESSRAEIPPIVCPTVVLWPQRGRVNRPRHVKGAVNVVIPSAGHSVHAEAPVLITELIKEILRLVSDKPRQQLEVTDCLALQYSLSEWLHWRLSLSYSPRRASQ